MNASSVSGSPARPASPNWKEIVAKYQAPAPWRGTWQVINTLTPYVAAWCLMYWSLSISAWLTVPLVVIAGGLMVRVFIISHDCGHGSFFKSKRANEILGTITGVLSFTPYHHWRWEHSVHHATSGDLDRRGTGDVWTLTVQEYLEASRWKRFAYRLARNPVILFIIAPLVLFGIRERFPTKGAGKRERLSVYGTNLALLVYALGMGYIFGWKAWILLQLGVLMVAGSAGVWLFYVQHQFEGVYWERREHWDYEQAALQGSSFYKLPRILQWFSGNIGFHHIHHLSPRIPNYNLEKCHNSEPLFQTVKPVTLLSSLKALNFRLWDEQHQRLVGYRALRAFRKRAPVACR
jgi:omega-6 fatty acid desaturase (delta-12 desaturase)